MRGALLLLAALALVLVAGGFPRRTGATRVVGVFAGGFVAGAVLLHLLLTALQLAGVAWSMPAVLAIALLAAVAWRARRIRLVAPRFARPGWGLLAGGVPIAFFGFLSAVRLAHSPDFVYHWGLKAARWVAAGGVDGGLLDRAGAWRIHPDYPQLVTELLALPGLLVGAFDERAALLEAALLGALTLVAFRFALRRRGVAGFELEAATAACGAAVGGFGFVHGTAGGADAAIAFALLVGVAALVAPRDRDADATLAFAAAFAAAAKIEGVPLAVLLVAAAALRDRGDGADGAARRAALRLLPTLLVVLPWAWQSRDRFLPANAGPPRWSELPAVLAGLGRAALHPDGGLFPLLLLLLPVVATVPALRPAALVLAAQSAVVVALYLISPVDLPTLMSASAPRLLSQLVPSALLLAVLRLSAPALATADIRLSNNRGVEATG